MNETPLLDARDLRFLDDNFVEIFAADARFRASMQAGRDLLHFIAAQVSALDDTEQAQDDWFTSTLNTVPAARVGRDCRPPVRSRRACARKRDNGG